MEDANGVGEVENREIEELKAKPSFPFQVHQEVSQTTRAKDMWAPAEQEYYPQSRRHQEAVLGFKKSMDIGIIHVWFWFYN